MNIFVARLDYNTQEGDLRYAFEEFGAVDSAKIIMDKYTGQSKGYGFVEMSNDDDAQAAIAGLNGQLLDGRSIVVKKAEPRKSRSTNNTYSGGYGYGSTY